MLLGLMADETVKLTKLQRPGSDDGVVEIGAYASSREDSKQREKHIQKESDKMIG